MGLFLSTFTNKVDKKGRVSVPASFRTVITGQHFQGIVAYPSFIHECIEACGMNRIEQLSSSIDSLEPFSVERDAFATTILGSAQQLGFDSEGRILLPESLLSLAKIGEQAVFIGKGQTFEIWEPATFQEYLHNARETAKTHRGSLQLQSAAHKEL